MTTLAWLSRILGGRKSAYIAVIVLMAITAYVFSPALRDSLLNYDSPHFVSINKHVPKGLTLQGVLWAFSTTYTCNWHPLTWLSFMLDVELFGGGARTFLTTNIALHALNGGLFFGLLFVATRRLWPCLIAAALFALHPMRVESVAWVAERKDLVCAFFWLLALITYVYWVQRKHVWLYVLTIALALCAMMSKPMAVTIPLTLLLLDWWPLERFNNAHSKFHLFKRLLLEKVPFVIASAALSVATYFSQTECGAMGHVKDATLLVRIANAFNAYTQYLSKFFFPSHLSIYYPFHPKNISPSLYIPVGLLLLGVLLTITLRNSHHKKYLAMGFIWFIVTLFPTIGIVQVGSQSMADRYSYIPFIGICIAVAFLFSQIIRINKFYRYAFSIITAFVIIAFAFLTYNYCTVWSSPSAVFKHALHSVGDDSIIHMYLARSLHYENRCDEALPHYFKAAETNNKKASLYEGIGTCLLRTGKGVQSIPYFKKALRIDEDSRTAHYYLGYIYYKLGKLKTSLHFIRSFAESHEDDLRFHELLAAVYYNLGDMEAAIRHYTIVLQADPQYEWNMWNPEPLSEDIGVGASGINSESQAPSH